MECENKSNTGDMGTWNYLPIIQKIPEQHNWKVTHQLTIKQEFLGIVSVHQKILIYIYKGLSWGIALHVPLIVTAG